MAGDRQGPHRHRQPVIERRAALLAQERDHPAEHHHVVIEGVGRRQERGGHEQRHRQHGVAPTPIRPHHRRHRGERDRALESPSCVERQMRDPRIHEDGRHHHGEDALALSENLALDREHQADVLGPDVDTEQRCGGDHEGGHGDDRRDDRAPLPGEHQQQRHQRAELRLDGEQTEADA
jgi:hypothetical protein